MWGKSMALRIPQPIAEKLGLTEEHELELNVQYGELCIRTITPTNTYVLDHLVRRINPENRHSLVEFGMNCGVVA